MEENPEFKVRNEKIEGYMRDIADRIRKGLGDGDVFALFIAPAAGGTFYAANSNRLSMVKLLHEHVERHCKGPDFGHGCHACGCPAAAWERNKDGGYKV